MKNIFSVIVMLIIANTGWTQLYISTGATLSLSGNAQVSLQDIDLVNDGVISAPADGRFIFNGVNNNFISGNASTSFSELEIAKTGSGLLTLRTDINVKNKIVFTSNLIDLNNHNIDLGTTGLLEGENENSHITGTSGGQVLFSTVLNAPVSANPGNLGAVITTSQDLGNTIIRRGHQSQVNNSGNGSSIFRYYDIIPTNNTALNATLRINYLDAEKNSLDENSLEIFKSDDNVNWVNEGYSTKDAIQNYVEQTGIDNFSRWTLSTSLTALPVTGLQLSGQWKNNAAYLNWTTMSEYNNSHFNIERKYNDEFNFVTIGSKNSKYADGNSQTPTVYNWMDMASSDKGPIQYRIQQTDLDNNYSYSNIIIIKPESTASFIKNVYPNPSVQNQLYIKTGNSNITKMQVFIYDMKGSLLFHKQLNYESQWISLSQINAGDYKLFIQSGELRWTGSFLKK